MKKKIAAVLLTVCFMLINTNAAYAEETATEQTGTVKIVSANMLTTSKCAINYESDGQNIDRGQILFDLLKDEGIDSAGLCEVNSKWFDYLENACGENKDYAMVGLTACSGASLTGGGNEYTPIIYRTDKYELVEDGGWWLSDTPDEKSKIVISGRESMKYERTLAYAVLKSKETGEIAYIHLNTHLDHKSEDKINVMCLEVLTEKAAYLKDRFGDVPFVLTGDFNCNEETRAYRYIADSEYGFVDAKYLSEDRDIVPTFVGILDNFHPELHPKKIIDFVFVSAGNVETVQSRVVENKYFSDHSVIWSELIMNDNGSTIGTHVEPEQGIENKATEATQTSPARTSGLGIAAGLTGCAIVIALIIFAVFKAKK